MICFLGLAYFDTNYDYATKYVCDSILQHSARISPYFSSNPETCYNTNHL